MARGKYAEKARNRQDAERRYASEVAETNRLRTHIRELRRMEEENERLRASLAEARQALDGSELSILRARLAERERQLELFKKRMADLFAERTKEYANWFFLRFTDLLRDELGLTAGSPKAKRLLTRYLGERFTFTDSAQPLPVQMKQFEAAMQGFAESMKGWQA